MGSIQSQESRRIFVHVTLAADGFFDDSRKCEIHIKPFGE